MSSGGPDYVWRNVAKQIARGRFARFSRDGWVRELWHCPDVDVTKPKRRGPPPMASQFPKGFRGPQKQSA